MSIFLNGKLVEPTIFPDGTSQVWKLEDYVNAETKEFKILFVWENNEAEVFHLFQLFHMLRYHFRPITLITPYLPYARQDKPVGNENCFALSTFIRILTDLDMHLLYKVCDAHPPNAQDFGIDSYYPSALKHFIETEYDVIIFPDKGAKARYHDMFKHKLIYTCDKVREQSTGKILSLDVPSMDLAYKKVCVLDDLCDGGGTFNWLSQAMTDIPTGPTETFDLVVTHGLFSKGLSELLSNFNSIVTTDSLYRPEVFDLNIAAKQCPEFARMKRMKQSGRFFMLSSDE